MKKVAIIQDLSSFGKCSLTAAIPALSVMGVQAVPLPTAIFSAQTGYPSYFSEDLTTKMPYFQQEWDKLQVTFDGIHTGYITGKDQVQHILQFLDRFKSENTLLLVDPVMGDMGEAYTNFDDELLQQMRELVTRADVITPNLTECCLLTGYSYERLNRYADKLDYLQAVQEAGLQLQQMTDAHIIITGVNAPNAKSADASIGNMYMNGESSTFSLVPYNGKSYSGTGDLFASVIMGSLMRGEDMATAIELAETFLSAAIRDTDMEGVPTVEGINFERYLRMLL